MNLTGDRACGLGGGGQGGLAIAPTEPPFGFEPQTSLVTLDKVYTTKPREHVGLQNENTRLKRCSDCMVKVKQNRKQEKM